MKEKTFISVVVYVHNDEANVGQFLLTLDQFLHQRFETHEIILADDASTDAAVRAAFAVKDDVQGNVTIVQLSIQHGRERALSAGTDLCIGDLIFEVDNISSPLREKDLTAMLAILGSQGVDMVLGSRRRLVTRRALYAMETSTGGTRTERYLNCGFDWAPLTGEPPARKPSGVLSGPQGFHNLLIILAILSAAAGVILTLIALAVPGLMLAGFAVVLWSLGIAHKRMERSGQTLGDYKVKEITRINRY